MKILISAYACEPDRGAEPGVGWNIVREIAKKHELWVLTREDNKPAIENNDEAWVKAVHWQFVDPPRWITRWKKGSLILRLFYLIWQRSAYNQAKTLSKMVEFDLVHHLTFGTFLVPSLLHKLGKPTVIGPVGGGEVSPPLLRKSYSFSGRVSEFSRDFMRWLVQKWPRSRAWLMNGTVVIAATKQSQTVLELMGLDGVQLLPQSGVGNDEVDRFSKKYPRSTDAPSGPIKLVAASRLIHWKAIDLAIEAVSLARTRGSDVKLKILQNGPERSRLVQLVEKFKLKERVTFTGLLPHLDDVYSVISEADALIHPALHEVFGQVCIEAFALGVPVICIDWCGPGMIVDDETGYKVPPGTREETISRLADSIIQLEHDRYSRGKILEACKKRAYDEFHWSRIAQELDSSYSIAVSKWNK